MLVPENTYPCKDRLYTVASPVRWDHKLGAILEIYVLSHLEFILWRLGTGGRCTHYFGMSCSWYYWRYTEYLSKSVLLATLHYPSTWSADTGNVLGISGIFARDPKKWGTYEYFFRVHLVSLTRPSVSPPNTRDIVDILEVTWWLLKLVTPRFSTCPPTGTEYVLRCWILGKIGSIFQRVPWKRCLKRSRSDQHLEKCVSTVLQY